MCNSSMLTALTKCLLEKVKKKTTVNFCQYDKYCTIHILLRAPDRENDGILNLLVSFPNPMLWVLIRIVSSRQF